ncbi:MAG TPA: hypothetical protein DIT04_12595 [Dysgonomonas sp.]|nr:hypothetical protein [Dysgonomonas sp.]
MKKKTWKIPLFLMVLFLTLYPFTSYAQPEGIIFKQADPLDKIMPDQNYFVDSDYQAALIRGERASFQFVVKSVSDIKNLKIEAGNLTNGSSQISPNFTAFVGYVKVGRNIINPSIEKIESPSRFYPDPLIEVEYKDVPAMQNQPVWVSYTIPKDASPGIYTGNVKISGTIKGSPFEMTKQVKAKIYGINLPEQKLWVTNWFNINENNLKLLNSGSPVELYSDHYWNIMKLFANIMRDHGQNVYIISPHELCKYTLNNGKYSFDFSNFDKMVSIFLQEGNMKRIEGGHIGGRVGDWMSPMGIRVPVGDGKFRTILLSNDSARNYITQFIPALDKHLKEKKWDKIYLQHIADEPIEGASAHSYVEIATLVKQLAPEFKIIEANHSQDVANTIDVWVPQLNFFKDDYEFYKERQQKDDEVWFYTCLAPQGNYANRFLEQPLIQTRILHWINYRYGATGYLHWGLNYWKGDPYYETTAINEESGNILPGGDSWIVYPAQDKLYSSIRFETMYDGIVDYELLKELDKTHPAEAAELARTIVYRFDWYDNNIDTFRKKRTEILELLSKR